MKEEVVEERIVEHQKIVERKENTRARDSKNISSFDITDENTLVEEKEDEQKEYENREDVPVEEGEKEEPDEYKEDEDDKERTGILKKMTTRSKGRQKLDIFKYTLMFNFYAIQFFYYLCYHKTDICHYLGIILYSYYCHNIFKETIWYKYIQKWRRN